MQGININVKSQEETHTDLNILVFFLISNSCELHKILQKFGAWNFIYHTHDLIQFDVIMELSIHVKWIYSIY